LKKTFVFIFFILNILIFSQNYNFNDITNIDPYYEKLIKIDLKSINEKDYFYYFCIVSDSIKKYDFYLQKYEKLSKEINDNIKKDFGRTDINNLDLKTQKKVAENILIYLHDIILKKYAYNSSTVDLIFDNNEFNCVSSSILYSIFLKKYNFDVSGIETIDHVFVEIEFQNEKIDVETTNKYGFDPGKKKEVLDNFGKLTGFTYVPSKDYKNRNKIDFKKMFFLVCHNQANILFKNEEYVKSINLGYLISLGRNDEKGKDDFNSYFNNFIVILSNSKKYKTAITLIDSYFEKFGLNFSFKDIRNGLLYNYIYDLSDINDYQNIKKYLISENEKFSQIKDDSKFIETYFYLLYKIVKNNNQKNDFDKSFNEIKEFNNKYKYKETQNVFNETLIKNIKYLSKETNLVLDLLNKCRSTFPEYISVINDNERIVLYNEVSNLLDQKKYSSALNESKKLNIIYPLDKDVLNLMKNCYVSLSIQYYEDKDYEKAISISEEAMKIFYNDKIFYNNYKVFYQDYILNLFQKKDFTKARKINNQAMEIFKNEAIFLKFDQNLKNENY